jgi:glutamate-5-semialdehyde dehydrogenase
LVHQDLLKSDFFTQVAQALIDAQVTLKCDAASLAHLQKQLPASNKLEPSVEEDYHTEFLDHIIAVKVVADVSEAVEHINDHGSKHTDSIITENAATADYFMTRVDAAGCYWNTSTRFADGFRYGFGAEVGVSTNKTHARGPVGLEGLVIYKYRAYGNGNIAGDYGTGKKQFLHDPIAPSDYHV